MSLTEINVCRGRCSEVAIQEIVQGPGAGNAAPGSGQTASPHLERLSLVTSRSFFAREKASRSRPAIAATMSRTGPDN